MLSRNFTHSNFSLPVGCSSLYPYGFNGKEKLNELEGGGNVYDYGFRIYNASLAKFLSIDPLFQSYPFYSPYHFAGNSPILNIDVDGLETFSINNGPTAHHSRPPQLGIAVSKSIIGNVQSSAIQVNHLFSPTAETILSFVKASGGEHHDNVNLVTSVVGTSTKSATKIVVIDGQKYLENTSTTTVTKATFKGEVNHDQVSVEKLFIQKTTGLKMEGQVDKIEVTTTIQKSYTAIMDETGGTLNLSTSQYWYEKPIVQKSNYIGPEPTKGFLETTASTEFNQSVSEALKENTEAMNNAVKGLEEGFNGGGKPPESSKKLEDPK